MPHAVTADQFRDARLIVANEFRGLDTHDQYYNAFARLLKRDPLDRVTMLGTDQRDRFVPAIRALLDARPGPKRILDIGCGDGQTFALLAPSIAPGSTIDLVDPNEDYVHAYAERLEELSGIALGSAHPRPFAPDPAHALYAPANDLILAIHSLYFFEDLGACLADIEARLAPGGTAIIVFADESVSYTGICYRAWQRHLGREELADAHALLCAERLRWLAGARPALGERLEVQVLPQPTRLFGHSLADMLALCNIAGLSLYEDIAKFAVAADVLEQAPDSVGFRIEDEGPRLGMFSVLQPQIVCAAHKPA